MEARGAALQTSAWRRETELVGGAVTVLEERGGAASQRVHKSQVTHPVQSSEAVQGRAHAPFRDVFAEWAAAWPVRGRQPGSLPPVTMAARCSRGTARRRADTVTPGDQRRGSRAHVAAQLRGDLTSRVASILVPERTICTPAACLAERGSADLPACFFAISRPGSLVRLR